MIFDSVIRNLKKIERKQDNDNNKKYLFDIGEKRSKIIDKMYEMCKCKKISSVVFIHSMKIFDVINVNKNIEYLGVDSDDLLEVCLFISSLYNKQYFQFDRDEKNIDLFYKINALMNFDFNFITIENYIYQLRRYFSDVISKLLIRNSDDVFRYVEIYKNLSKNLCFSMLRPSIQLKYIFLKENIQMDYFKVKKIDMKIFDLLDNKLTENYPYNSKYETNIIVEKLVRNCCYELIMDNFINKSTMIYDTKKSILKEIYFEKSFFDNFMMIYSELIPFKYLSDINVVLPIKINYCIDDKHFYFHIFMEKYTMDLKKIAYNYSQNDRLKFVKENFKNLLKNLLEIQERCIVHGDIKCENIFVKKENNSIGIEISDFGSSNMMTNEQFYNCYTLTHKPEECSDDKLLPDSDVWAFGVTILEFIFVEKFTSVCDKLTKINSFFLNEMKKKKIVFDLIKECIQELQHKDVILKDMIKKIFVNPTDRIDFYDIMNHPFFN